MSKTPLYRNVSTPTHGRTIVLPAESPSPRGRLIAFHGYAQSAEDMLFALRRAPAIQAHWNICAVQALHRFYSVRNRDVVASWMTRQDREQAIEDNLQYIHNVLDDSALCLESPGNTLVFLGFSQGAAMAWRVGTRLLGQTRAIAAIGGDLPPDLEPAAFSDWPGTILIARGKKDRIYSQDRAESDIERLRKHKAQAMFQHYEGKHELNPAFTKMITRFLENIEQTQFP
jgi:predicted esterase